MITRCDGCQAHSFRPKQHLLLSALLLAGCSTFSPKSLPDNFIVFFGASDAQLSLEAKDVVNQAALAIQQKHPARVIVAGEPKTVVAPGFNPRLADPRFEAVERALLAQGVDPKLLSRAALTDDQAKVGVTGNRRVEINLYQARAQ